MIKFKVDKGKRRKGAVPKRKKFDPSRVTQTTPALSPNFILSARITPAALIDGKFIF